ncbi:hypothetical protein M407DRAFT_155486 [Tulasnella calospora MUT 4182]|uniref:Uncharacterized protein n=1 Tax=Tulasnella calospora MUT 4182 TaxID=1051891 RepID=A0A0C3QPS7_9AGAM|nr:hypothetical protein M407DRAFT_155486 [Tulasnella calospora MUT 4182]
MSINIQEVVPYTEAAVEAKLPKTLHDWQAAATSSIKNISDHSKHFQSFFQRWSNMGIILSLTVSLLNALLAAHVQPASYLCHLVSGTR